MTTLLQKKSVRCQIQGFRSSLGKREISFNIGHDLSFVPVTTIGPQGISPVVADLLDFAAAVFQIEREITLGRKLTNPPEHFELSIQLRKPKVWNESAIQAVSRLLSLLGNARWTIDVTGGLELSVPKIEKESSENKVNQVVLFSGGMDSTCGAATLKKASAATRLVSIYSRQRKLQSELATSLGFPTPHQWRMKWSNRPGPGRSFFYRSFLYLVVAAVIAESWTARRILQFENGVLSTAIPPSPAWMMTKHAHPLLHIYFAELLTELFGGEWKIENPFLLLTKRGGVKAAESFVKPDELKQLLEKTESCWFQYSNRIKGGVKRPGVPCGVCIPCIVRRTALFEGNYYYDVRDDKVANDPQMGAPFRSYYGFLERIQKAGNSIGNFYSILPVAGRALINSSATKISIEDVQSLWQTFSKEFMETYLSS